MPTTRRRKRGAVERRLEDFARSKPGSWFFVNVAMRIDRVLLPLSRGRVSISVGQQVGMLETVGAKSGQVRRTPLLFVRDGNHVVLIASKAAPRGTRPGYTTSARTRRSGSSAPAASPASRRAGGRR